MGDRDQLGYIDNVHVTVLGILLYKCVFVYYLHTILGFFSFFNC